MENLASGEGIKNAVATSKNRQGAQGIELCQHCVNPVTMVHQQNPHLPFKALRELRDYRQALLDRKNRVDIGKISSRLVNPFTSIRKQLLDHTGQSINHIICPLRRFLEAETHFRHPSNGGIEPLPLKDTMSEHHLSRTDR